MTELAPAGPAVLLSIRGADHAFGGVHAVVDVNLELRGGEVCALLGENGAGKSTLMKAVAGALKPDAGEVLLDGEPLPLGDPGAVRDRGVSLIYQELNLVESLPAYENIALGRESRRGWFVDHRKELELAERHLSRLEADFDPRARVETLSVAQQQLVEIARALAGDTKVLIMDEPTSALSEREVARLFGIVRRLAERGVAIVFITHRLEEVAALADRVVVMRDGAVVTDAPRETLNEQDLVAAMVGRPLDRQFPERQRDAGEVLLQVEGLTLPRAVREVGFEVRSGEIVALSGLVGSGRTDVGRALFGVERARGTIRVAGRVVRFGHPAEAIAAGVGWVSEDRKGEGLVHGMSVLANLTLPHLNRFSRPPGWIESRREREAARGQIDRLRIRAVGPRQPVAELSGGNQQKVAFARWLVGECRVLICDEPTRGVDVSGRFEIYELLEQLARRGVAILMISSDMQEVLGMADRILVMHEGRISGELPAAEATQQRLLRLAMGQEPT